MTTRPDHYWRLPNCTEEDALAANEEDCDAPIALWKGRRWQVLGGYVDRPNVVHLVEITPDGRFCWYDDADERELDYVCHRWHAANGAPVGERHLLGT